MTNTLIEQYEKGYSPPAIQRRYSLSYTQGYELAQEFKKLKEQLKDANDIFKTFRCEQNYIMMDFDAIKSYIKKWGVE